MKTKNVDLLLWILYIQEIVKISTIIIISSDRETMNYFRAVFKSGEISERVYWLTTEILTYITSFYTVW